MLSQARSQSSYSLGKDKSNESSWPLYGTFDSSKKLGDLQQKKNYESPARFSRIDKTYFTSFFCINSFYQLSEFTRRNIHLIHKDDKKDYIDLIQNECKFDNVVDLTRTCHYLHHQFSLPIIMRWHLMLVSTYNLITKIDEETPYLSFDEAWKKRSHNIYDKINFSLQSINAKKLKHYDDMNSFSPWSPARSFCWEYGSPSILLACMGLGFLLSIGAGLLEAAFFNDYGLFNDSSFRSGGAIIGYTCSGIMLTSFLFGLYLMRDDIPKTKAYHGISIAFLGIEFGLINLVKLISSAIPSTIALIESKLSAYHRRTIPTLEKAKGVLVEKITSSYFNSDAYSNSLTNHSIFSLRSTPMIELNSSNFEEEKNDLEVVIERPALAR